MSEDKKMGYTNTTGEMKIDQPISYSTMTTRPTGYRLAKKKDGTLVLQGMYEVITTIIDTNNRSFSVEWCDIETVELDD